MQSRGPHTYRVIRHTAHPREEANTMQQHLSSIRVACRTRDKRGYTNALRTNQLTYCAFQSRKSRSLVRSLSATPEVFDRFNHDFDHF